MNLNKRGFTLVEVLTVIVIISLLGLIITIPVTRILKKSKNDLYNVELASIKSAAKSWGADNINMLPKGDSCKYITIRDLKKYGNLDSNIIDPRDNTPMPDDLKIKILSEVNDKGRSIISYEVDPSDLTGCEHIFDDVFISDGTPIYFDVKNGKICSASEYKASNSTIGYNGMNPTGEQSSCLKFYAFNDVEGETTIDLILDHNTTSNVKWSSVTGSAPKEVIEKLYQDTSSWTGVLNVPSYSITQVDGTSYNINYSAYKARLITANEVAKISSDNEFNETSSDNKNIVAFEDIEWLYDNIDKNSGYWTATKVANLQEYTWAVLYGTQESVPMSGEYGIRPVIRVSKSIMK